MEVSVEVSVVSATAASGGRSRSKRLTSSAAKCWASAAEPPLPQASALPPAFRDCAKRPAARAMAGASEAAAASLRRALSSKCAAILDSIARFYPLLRNHLELEAARRSRLGRKAADARGKRGAAVQPPGERRVLVPRHIAELAPAPRDAHRIRVVRVVTLTRELQAVADAQLLPDLRRGVIAKARQRRALHDQGDFLGLPVARDQ